MTRQSRGHAAGHPIDGKPGTEPGTEQDPHDTLDATPSDIPDGDMELFDLRVTVESIEGRSVCGMQVGDYFELVNSSQLQIPAGRHFCLYALQSVLPLLPAKQRQLPAADWLERDSLACCPDPEERTVMRIQRTARHAMNSTDLT